MLPPILPRPIMPICIARSLSFVALRARRSAGCRTGTYASRRVGAPSWRDRLYRLRLGERRRCRAERRIRRPRRRCGVPAPRTSLPKPGRPPGPTAREGGSDMSGPYLMAIDAGTGSCRAVLFTAAGEQVAARAREWTHHEPPGVPGGQDFDVAAGWRAIAACVRDALADARVTGSHVAAVAATSMREGVVIYDRSGREIWACPNVDSRSAEEARDLVRDGTAEKIYAEAGDWVSITTPARLRWLAR